MNITATLLSSLFSALKLFWWVVPILFMSILLKICKTRLFKGWLGETLVKTRLNRHLNKQQYTVFNDLMISDNRGSTQIDHIVVSVYGIFVIETKNYSGWIFGDERQAQWTRVYYQQKYHFQNPLRQNYRHIKSLSALLTLHESFFHSMVVFSGKYQFKTAIPDNVLDINQATAYIQTKRTALLSREQVNAINDTLGQAEFRSTHRKKRAHIAQLRRQHQTR